MGKEEIACYEYCFQKTCTADRKNNCLFGWGLGIFHTTNLGWSKFKAFVDNIINIVKIMIFVFNPIPNTQFRERPKFKEAAADNWNVASKGF